MKLYRVPTCYWRISNVYIYKRHARYIKYNIMMKIKKQMSGFFIWVLN